MERRALPVVHGMGLGDKPLDSRVFPTFLIERLAMSGSNRVERGGIGSLGEAQAAILGWWNG